MQKGSGRDNPSRPFPFLYEWRSGISKHPRQWSCGIQCKKLPYGLLTWWHVALHKGELPFERAGDGGLLCFIGHGKGGGEHFACASVGGDDRRGGDGWGGVPGVWVDEVEVPGGVAGGGEALPAEGDAAPRLSWQDDGPALPARVIAASQHGTVAQTDERIGARALLQQTVHLVEGISFDVAA